MKRKLIAVLLLGAVCASQPVCAADSDEVDRLLPLSLAELLDMNVTISTATQKKLSKAPAVVSVITADDIKATGATNLVDALQGVPGLYIRRNLFGFRPFIYMRGTNVASAALIMINGSPLKELVSSYGQYWQGLPASIIERIEIIRGPGSALYGADAASGVINIITKAAAGIHQSEAGVRAGSFDSRTAWIQHGSQWNGFDVAVTAELSHTDGHNPFIAQDKGGSAGRADYGYDNADIRFSIAQDNWRLLADHRQKSNIGIGLTGGGYLDQQTRGSDSHTELALLYKNASFAPYWGLDAEIRYRNVEFSSGDGYYEKPGVINQQRGAEQKFNFEVSGLYTGFRNHGIRLGGGYVWQDQFKVEQFVRNYFDPTSPTCALISDNTWYDASNSPCAFLPKKARINQYVFLQDVWTFADNWELTLGGRYDDYSDFGGTFNPRAALVWQTSDRLTTKLMYGTAFRAPSFLELYSLTSQSQGNSSLQPERFRSWEVAFSYLASRDLRLGLNVFKSTQDDVIVSGTPYQNSGTIESSGVELEAQWQATQALRLSAALSDRHDDLSKASQEPTYTPPRQLAYLRTDWNFLPKWFWNLQANWMGKHILKTSETISQPIGAYALADTTLRYQHDRQWEFSASIRNLFDKDAREYVPSNRLKFNLPLPGRNFWVEARYKF